MLFSTAAARGPLDSTSTSSTHRSRVPILQKAALFGNNQSPLRQFCGCDVYGDKRGYVSFSPVRSPFTGLTERRDTQSTRVLRRQMPISCVFTHTTYRSTSNTAVGTLRIFSGHHLLPFRFPAQAKFQYPLHIIVKCVLLCALTNHSLKPANPSTNSSITFAYGN